MSCKRQKFRHIRERFVIGLKDQNIYEGFLKTFEYCKATDKPNFHHYLFLH